MKITSVSVVVAIHLPYHLPAHPHFLVRPTLLTR
jgi:hypothetical protein